jgi:hypothetical protein
MVASFRDVAVPITARNWANDSSSNLNAARMSGNSGSGRATRKFPRAVPSE